MYLALATGQGDVDETASVLDTLVGATLGVLLLLLGLNLDAKKNSSEQRLQRAADGRDDGGAEYSRGFTGLTLGVAALTLPARAREP